MGAGTGLLLFNYSDPTTTISNVLGSTTTTAGAAIGNVGNLTFTANDSLGADVLTLNVAKDQRGNARWCSRRCRSHRQHQRDRRPGALVKTGWGTCRALSGTGDNGSLGVVVNAGTLLLNKTSSLSVHAIGGSGLIINIGGTVQFAANAANGTHQIYDGGSTDHHQPRRHAGYERSDRKYLKHRFGRCNRPRNDHQFSRWICDSDRRYCRGWARSTPAVVLPPKVRFIPRPELAMGGIISTAPAQL